MQQMYTQHYTEWGKTEGMSSKMRNENFNTLIWYGAWNLGLRNKAREWNKRNTNMEGRNQIIPTCRWYDPYLKDFKDSTRRLLDLINTFSKVTWNKVNIQKSIAFLLSSLSWEWNQANNPIHNHFKINKILWNKSN
jgi:hypothetical protein